MNINPLPRALAGAYFYLQRALCACRLHEQSHAVAAGDRILPGHHALHTQAHAPWLHLDRCRRCLVCRCDHLLTFATK